MIKSGKFKNQGVETMYCSWKRSGFKVHEVHQNNINKYCSHIVTFALL